MTFLKAEEFSVKIGRFQIPVESPNLSSQTKIMGKYSEIVTLFQFWLLKKPVKSLTYRKLHENKINFSFFRQIDDIAEFVIDLVSRNLSLRINANFIQNHSNISFISPFLRQIAFLSFFTIFWCIFRTFMKYFREIVDVSIFYFDG